MIDDDDDDDEERLIHAYPENHSLLPPLSSFSDLPPIVSLELPAVVSLPNLRLLPMIDDDTTPNIGIVTSTKNPSLFSFAYRIPDIIKKVLTAHEYWDTALVWFLHDARER